MSQLPRQPIDSLTAPGIAPVAVVPVRRNVGQQLMEALGASAGLATTAGAMAERERVEIEQEMDKALDTLRGKGFELGTPQPGFESPEAIEAYNTGLASRHALEFLSGLDEKIEKGEVAPAEGESVAERSGASSRSRRGTLIRPTASSTRRS